MPKPVVSVQDLSKRYYLDQQHQDIFGVAKNQLANLKRWAYNENSDATAPREKFFWALKDISFDVYQGERVGIIGKNGAGKSTLLKILSRLVYPTYGEAIIRGRVTSLLEVGTGFNDNLSGRENIYLNASLHGLSRTETDGIFTNIVDFSGTGAFLDTPVKHYSSGMKMRLAFSVAAHLDPDVLLLDEVLAVGDMSFQQKCLKRVEGLTSEGRTVLFVSHAMDSITRFCDRCLWLDKGEILEDGTAEEVVSKYVQEIMGIQSQRIWDQDAPSYQENAASHESSSNIERTGNGYDVSKVEASVPDDINKSTKVRLLSTRVISSSKNTVNSVSVHQKFGIEVVYEIFDTLQNIQPALHFKTADGNFVFVVAYTDSEYMHGLPYPGRYKAIAWIPPNLLNAGVLYVNVIMATPDPLEEYIFAENALSFNIHEKSGDFLTARGLYARDFPGCVRPLLTWETTSS